jgi:PIN domain nuclease of toxin-antitoxin system
MPPLIYLLDTHTLLWAIGKTSELSKNVIQEIKNPDNEILVSAVSLWEIALKCSIGKLKINFMPSDIPEYCEEMKFSLIPLEPLDAIKSMQLPYRNEHKDPFDRMLIYQCINNNYILISKDTQVKIYKEDGLQFFW